MKLVSYRSGSTSGMACGPVEGPFFGESMFYDNEGNSLFVLVSKLDCSLMVAVSEYSIFDIEYNAFNTYTANMDSEIEKSNKLKIKEHEFNTDDEDEDVDYGKTFPGYEKAVNFAIDLFHKDFDDNLSKKELEDILFEDIEDIKIEHNPWNEYYPIP